MPDPVNDPPSVAGATTSHAIKLNPALPARPSGLVFRGRSVSQLHEKMTYTSLEALEAMAGKPRSTTKCVLVLKICYHKKIAVDTKRGLYNRLAQAKTEGQNYDKTITVMDLNSPSGRNTGIILVNNARADVIFGQFIEGRDSMEGFGPGAVVVVQRPNPIDNYFGEDALRGLPVITFNGGFKLVDVNSLKSPLPMIPFLDNASRLQSFYYPKAKIIVTNVNICHSPCCGYLCDSIDLKKKDGSNSWSKSCPCYVVKTHVGQVLFDFNLKIVPADKDDTFIHEEAFTVSDFTSRQFTHLFTVAGIPSSVSAAMLEKLGLDVDIFFMVEELIEFVNDQLGGFNVLGWARRGFVRDASASGDSKPGEGPRVMSGTVIRHLTHVGINGDESKMKAKLVNVAELLQSRA